ncbi:uncharacterized protein LOC118756379 [Rhagoletis pomonella]|uniref:uncharacterized protein LOC118756379 n=1 Tax=Rhagoletis pomonella TaxID=28610 RepID=UPI001783A390|nr:uncharacterized protein LOC118756379 [Rhagoletis pomonella]
MYEEFINEYASLQHMVSITREEECSTPICYLSHHGVWKTSSSTSKLRVVFNASRRCNSGNDCLYSGPKLQNDLTAVVLNWRLYRIALTGDIGKMYRQILVDERDTDLQRIVWRPNSHREPTHFRLKTVTYGTNCAPYLAIKVLHTLSADERCNFPDAAQILLDEFYVDDVLTGADSLEDASRPRRELKGLLRAGGFTLRKWNSNSSAVLKIIDPVDIQTKSSREFQLEGEYNTLGLVWAIKDYCLTYALKLDYTVTTFTKRQLLSDVAKLFDPLGCIYARIRRCSVLKRCRLIIRPHSPIDVENTSGTVKESYSTTDRAMCSRTCCSPDEKGALKGFVSNRVSQIQEATTVSDWRYINTADNPADCASRGLTMAQLVDHHLWWHGPSCLSQPEASWPQPLLKAPEKLSESKPVQATTARTFRLIG